MLDRKLIINKRLITGIDQGEGGNIKYLGICLHAITVTLLVYGSPLRIHAPCTYIHAAQIHNQCIPV